MDKLIDQYYKEFQSLPNDNPIVRNNIKNDAFTLVVLDILYGKSLGFDISSSNIDRIKNIIIAPPDGGIDIFLEREDGDEFYYEIIQVKYSELAEQDIKQCFSSMERTIKEYLKDPKLVTKNLREVISNTSFDRTYKDKCTYYVVHKGDLNYMKAQKKNEKIVTCNDLDIIRSSLDELCVPKEIIKSDSFNNYILYEDKNNKEEKDIKNERAFLCNLSGYDLAMLNNKYSSTEIGRNILFGQNLRESLESKSKTYDAMKNTIDKEPEKFWYYNNGITIITEEFDANRKEDDEDVVDYIELNNFSIINGAQTTSSLGQYLKEARMNKEDEKIEKLKKVFVLTRILEVTNPVLKDNIAIYNNMQNPITTRDMVSNRYEQKRLYEWLSTGEKPHIYVEIRRGTKIPNSLRLQKHQFTTNEVLAQLAFASFFKSPFSAKDKKRTLFNNDYSQDEFVINKDYHKIFAYSDDSDKCGVLFKKSKEEINELLFISYLYKEGKKYLKKIYSERKEKAKNSLNNASEEERDSLEAQIATYTKQLEINNICLFYCVALYYEFKSQFADKEKDKVFKYGEFYSNLDFRSKLVREFATKFLSKTIELIKRESEVSANVGNWVRSVKNQNIFLKKLRDDIAINIDYETEFESFINEFKESVVSK